MTKVTTGNSGQAARFTKPSKVPAAPSHSRTRRSPTQKTIVNESSEPNPRTKPPKAWKHQLQTKKFAQSRKRVFDCSDPGTGKTRAHLELFAARRAKGSLAALVVAPRTLLKLAWADDAAKFTPELRCSIARAANRAEAFAVEADIYLTNTDAATWLAKQPRKFFDKFDTLIIDESTYFKHRTSARSKAIAKIKGFFEYRTCMTGTPNPKTVLNLWHQAYILDDGERLGRNFFQFRAAVCEPVQVGPKAEHVKWVDKPGMAEAVGELLNDISIRHKFPEVMKHVPPNYTRSVNFYPSNALINHYRKMEDEAVLKLKKGNVNAVNAAVLRNKLLQIASGAVYGEDEGYHLLDMERYELIIELAAEVEHSIIFFNWSHQKLELLRAADKVGLSAASLDGKSSDKAREEVVYQFQNGDLRSIILHPETGAHGLTLTRGTRCIWSSPVYRPDFIVQGRHRIWRGIQNKVTETLLVQAVGTVEEQVYKQLGRESGQMDDFLAMIETSRRK